MVSYFDCLSRLFQNLFVNHHSSQGVSLFFKEIGGQSGKKPIDLKVIIKALELSHSSGTVSLTSLSSASISKMRGFTALLNLLPMAIYFSATERDAIIYRLVFVDILSFRVLFDFDSDPLIVESFIGFVASLRLLLLKAMQTRSDKLITVQL